MTLRTSLVINGDSSGAQQALNAVDTAMEGVAADAATAAAATDKYATSSARAAAEARLLAQGIDTTGKEWERASVALGRLDSAQQQSVRTGQEVVASAGAQKAGMQQLSYQLSDAATMFALGARPMQIFASQGGQVLQAVTLMTGGTGRLGAFLGGPWGIAVVAATTVLTPFIGKLFDTADAADTARNALQSAFDAFQNGLPKASALSDTMTEASKTVAVASAKISELRTKLDKIGGSDAYKQGTFLAQQIKAQERIIADANAKVEQAVEQTKVLSGQQDRLAQSTEKTTAATNRHGGAVRAASAAISEEAKALNQAEQAAKGQLESLQKQIATYGKSPREVRAYEIATLAAATANKELAQQLIDAGHALDQLDIQKATKDYDDMIARLQAENEMLGLVGPAREKAALALEEQGFKAKAAADGIQDVEGAWQRYLRVRTEGIDQQTALDADIAKAGILQDQIGSIVNALKGLGGIGGIFGNVLAAVNGQYGAVGGPIGALLQIVTGTRTDEKTGQVMARYLGDELKDIFGIGGEFAGMLTSVLGNAGVGSAAAGAITGNRGTGAQIGGAVGGAVGGALAGSLMSSYAGVAMQAAVSNALGGAIGSALGTAVPVIGTILGGIAGNLIMGAFSSTKWGRAVISDGSGDFAIQGNKGSFKDAASEAGGAVVGALNQIAEQLGGTLGSFEQIAVGVRDGKWRVNVGSTSLKTSNGAVDFGKEGGAEAVSYAIQQAIKLGAIDGMREGTLNLLKQGDDFQAALEKALAFEGVFKAIEAQTNPLKAAMQGIAQQAEQLTAIFQEAGASAAEYAQLQQLIDIQTQAAIAAASQTYFSNFGTPAQQLGSVQSLITSQLAAAGLPNITSISAYTSAVNAADPTSDAYGVLIGLADEFAQMQQIQQQQAAEAAAAEAQRLAIAQQRAQMEIELLQLQGKAEEALVKQRELELAAIDQSLRAIQQEIYAAQDLAAAKDVLRQAWDRESASLKQTADQFGQLGDRLRSFRHEIVPAETATGSAAAYFAQLRSIGTLAGLGDAEAMGKLPDAGKNYLEAALAEARSSQEALFARATVARYTDSAIGAADIGKSMAEQQLDQMKTQVSALIEIDEHVVSVAEAIERLTALTAPTPPAEGGGSGPSDREAERARRREEIFRRRDERMARFEAAMNASVFGINRVARQLEDWDRGGNMGIATDGPIQADVIA